MTLVGAPVVTVGGCEISPVVVTPAFGSEETTPFRVGVSNPPVGWPATDSPATPALPPLGADSVPVAFGAPWVCARRCISVWIASTRGWLGSGLLCCSLSVSANKTSGHAASLEKSWDIGAAAVVFVVCSINCFSAIFSARALGTPAAINPAAAFSISSGVGPTGAAAVVAAPPSNVGSTRVPVVLIWPSPSVGPSAPVSTWPPPSAGPSRSARRNSPTLYPWSPSACFSLKSNPLDCAIRLASPS